MLSNLPFSLQVQDTGNHTLRHRSSLWMKQLVILLLQMTVSVCKFLVLFRAAHKQGKDMVVTKLAMASKNLVLKYFLGTRICQYFDISRDLRILQLDCGRLRKRLH